MLVFILPKCSTYGICANMYHTNQLNIGKYLYTYHTWIPWVVFLVVILSIRQRPCDTRFQGIQKQYQPYTNLQGDSVSRVKKGHSKSEVYILYIFLYVPSFDFFHDVFSMAKHLFFFYICLLQRQTVRLF